MTIATRVEQVLREHGAPYKLVAHKPTGSTHESAEAARVRDDHIAKAVVVRDARGPAMAVIPGDTWLDVEALTRETGRPVRGRRGIGPGRAIPRLRTRGGAAVGPGLPDGDLSR